MDLDEYQRLAATTDQRQGEGAEGALTIPLLGIAGETGTLLAEFKKRIRDKESYEGFNARAEEELGDILWYLSTIATRLNLSLGTVASKNLQKTQERWPLETDANDLFHTFDSAFPQEEQLPRQLLVDVRQDPASGIVTMRCASTGRTFGDGLTDNAYQDDGYRFHDVFHLAHAAVLGWSPVLRKLLGCKRKSDVRVDEVEDGARAAILEELIVAYVYSNARERRYYDGVLHLDSDLLASIKALVGHVEVRVRKMKDWEDAILQGYAAFRFLLEHKQARLTLDTDRQLLRAEAV